MSAGRMYSQLGNELFSLDNSGVWLWTQQFTAMHLTSAQFVLWLVQPALETFIVMAMIFRKLWHRLPIFFSYLIFEIARTVFLFHERNHELNYFYAYWVTEALGCFAAFCVIKELFDSAFQRHLGLRRLGNVLFQWSIAVLLAIAAFIAWASGGPKASKIMASILTVKRAVTFC